MGKRNHSKQHTQSAQVQPIISQHEFIEFAKQTADQFLSWAEYLEASSKPEALITDSLDKASYASEIAQRAAQFVNASKFDHWYVSQWGKRDIRQDAIPNPPTHKQPTLF